MDATRITGINKAIEAAGQFGFTKQLIWVNGLLKKAGTGRTFLKQDFAIVRSFVIRSVKGYKGAIFYIVLNDGTLGYLIKETKLRLKKKSTKQVEKNSHYDTFLHIFLSLKSLDQPIMQRSGAFCIAKS